MTRLIDAWALMDYCNSQKDKTIDANDIARFPTAYGWTSIKDNHVHLCNSCYKSYPECFDDEPAIEFGDGIGGDNICCCNKYEPLMEHDYDRGGYK